jgi:hypothetical protein
MTKKGYIAPITRETVKKISRVKTSPGPELENEEKDLIGTLGEFPLYGFFLYSTFDEYFSKFIAQRASWLNEISGEDILICVFENPSGWDKNWKEDLKEKLGDKFEKFYEEWASLAPEDRDLSYKLADALGVDKNMLPCLIIIQKFADKKFLYIPIITDETNYKQYFSDIFNAIHYMNDEEPEKKFQAFQEKWRIIWVKSVLPEKIVHYNDKIKKWGSMIAETKDAFISIIDVVSPLISNLKASILK